MSQSLLGGSNVLFGLERSCEFAKKLRKYLQYFFNFFIQSVKTQNFLASLFCSMCVCLMAYMHIYSLADAPIQAGQGANIPPLLTNFLGEARHCNYLIRVNGIEKVLRQTNSQHYHTFHLFYFDLLQSVAGMMYYCRPTWKLASPWLPRQKANGILDY